MDHEIIYLYDPLCGWCYGFSPVMVELHAQFREELPFTVLAGGMVTGERVGPIGKVAPYVRTAYKRVEELSGVKFGEKFVQMMEAGGDTVFNSEPPSRAAYILKDAFPKQTVAIAHGVQDVIYKLGLDPNLASSYHELATSFGMPIPTFDQHFESHHYRVAVQDEFAQVTKFGVTGFPTVVYRTQDQYYLVSNGYTGLDNVKNTLVAIQLETKKN